MQSGNICHVSIWLNCEHLSCEHLSCEHISCEHLSYAHMSCEHLSDDHLSCEHVSCEHKSGHPLHLLASMDEPPGPRPGVSTSSLITPWWISVTDNTV